MAHCLVLQYQNPNALVHHVFSENEELAVCCVFTVTVIVFLQ